VSHRKCSVDSSPDLGAVAAGAAGAILTPAMERVMAKVS
jgi:hypothetical protein